MVSAIVLAYNRCSEVLITIAKLKSYAGTLPFELDIIVIDNNSGDNTYVEVKAIHPDITVIKREHNNGVAGWNDGFAVCTDKYMLVLDDDSHITGGLPDAINYMHDNPSVGILALNIKDAEFRDDEKLDPRDAWQDKQDIIGFIGCGAIIRNDLYKTIGGFSEWLHVYSHEFDYSIRCLNAGSKIRFFESAVVVHRASKVNRTNKRLIVFSVRNELGIIYKYFRNNKFKYSSRIIFNNLNNVKKQGMAAVYYVMLGLFEFLKIRKKLIISPVSQYAQDVYSGSFWSTKPVFANLKRKMKDKFGRGR